MKACCLETYNEGYNRGMEYGMEYKEQYIIKLLTEDGKRNYISEDTYNYVVSVIQGTDEEL